MHRWCGIAPGKEGYAPVAAAAELLLDANETVGTIRTWVTTDDFFPAIPGTWQIDFADGEEPRLAWLMDGVDGRTTHRR